MDGDKKLAACLALDSVLLLTAASPPPGWSLPFCFTAEMGELKGKSTHSYMAIMSCIISFGYLYRSLM